MRRDELGLGIVATVALGVPFLLIEVGQRSFSTPMMASTRVALAALFLGLLTVLGPRRARSDLRRLLVARPLAASLVALTAAALPNLLIGAGERHVPTGATAVLLALTPVWIAVGSVFVDHREPVRMRQWSALVGAVAGVALVCGASAPSDDWGWYALPLGASLSYAVAALVVRHRLASFHPLAVTTCEMVVATVLLAPTLLAAPGPTVVGHGPLAPAILAVAVAGIGCSGLGWMANTALTQRAGAVRASVVSYTAVVVSVALGVTVLSEPLTVRTAAGTAVLVLSVWGFLSPPNAKERRMLELSILGFLHEESMHAYELRRRITALSGHARPVSDGALTPALRRMERSGLVTASREPGSGGPARKVFTITESGHDELLRRLADPDDIDITNSSRFFTLLAFLDRLPDSDKQRAVLERRLMFLEEPGRGFFVGEAGASRFRAGMTAMARGISTVERRWLRETIDALPNASSAMR